MPLPATLLARHDGQLIGSADLLEHPDDSQRTPGLMPVKHAHCTRTITITHIQGYMRHRPHPRHVAAERLWSPLWERSHKGDLLGKTAEQPRSLHFRRDRDRRQSYESAVPARADTSAA